MNLPPPLIPPSARAPEADVAPTACVNCGSIRFSPQTRLPVCEPCRVSLIKYPFPLWVKGAAALVAVMVVVSLAMSQERIAKRLHVVHAQKILGQGRWEEAFQEYQSFIAQHEDTKTLLNYAEAAAYSGHLQEAAHTMRELAGREASWSDSNRGEAIYNILKASGLAASISAGQPSVQISTSPIQLQSGSSPVNNLQLQPAGQLSGFQLQQTPLGSGSMNLNNTPIRLQTR